jgi:hypothetical protein
MHLAQTGMIATGRLARQQRFYVAQAFCLRELGKQQGQQQFLGAQPTHARIRATRRNQSIQRGPGKQVRNLAEYSILVRHGVGSSHVRFVGKRLELRRINAMRRVHQNPTGQPCGRARP